MRFFSHEPAVDPDGEFTDLSPGIDPGLDPGLTLHETRHTGGMEPVVGSNSAISDDNPVVCIVHRHLLIEMI